MVNMESLLKELEKLPREIYDIIMINYINKCSYIEQIRMIDIDIKNFKLKKMVMKNLEKMPMNFNELTNNIYKKYLDRNKIECKNVYMVLIEDAPLYENGMETIRFWEKSGINVNFNWILMVNASRINNTEMIKYLIEREYYERYESEFAYFMLMLNNQEILNIIDERNLNITIANYLVDDLCSMGMLGMIEWIYERKEKYGFNYTEKAMAYASGNNNLSILRWMKDKFKEELKYDDESFDEAAYNGCFEVMDWWITSGYEIKTSDGLFTNLFEAFYFNIEVINYIKNNNEYIKIKYDEEIFDNAVCDGSFDILEWWHNSGLQVKYSSDILDYISMPESANWMIIHKYDITFTDYALENIESLEMLIWWIEFIKINNLKIKINKKRIIENAMRYDNEELIKYCKENEF